STFEAVEALLDKRLTGFGELFRMLSYQEVGEAAMLSRAQAGVVKGRALFSLPGSPNACRLALEKLILPELGRVARELGRSPAGPASRCSFVPAGAGAGFGSSADPLGRVGRRSLRSRPRGGPSDPPVPRRHVVSRLPSDGRGDLG